MKNTAWYRSITTLFFRPTSARRRRARASMQALEDRMLLSAVGALPQGAPEAHPVVPAFSSQPGAAYTIYLDFAGFSFNGA